VVLCDLVVALMTVVLVDAVGTSLVWKPTIDSSFGVVLVRVFPADRRALAGAASFTITVVVLPVVVVFVIALVTVGR